MVNPSENLSRQPNRSPNSETESKSKLVAFSESDVDEPFPASDGDTALLSEQEADPSPNLDFSSLSGPVSTYPESEDDIPISNLIHGNHISSGNNRRTSSIIPSGSPPTQPPASTVQTDGRVNSFLPNPPSAWQHNEPRWWNR